VSDTIFNDKNMMIVDPIDSRFAYAVWGRLDDDGSGPAWFSRTTDRGVTWEPSRSIFDPGSGNQTFGNNVAVTSEGVLVNVFMEILRNAAGTTTSTKLRAIRSTDRGITWSPPIDVAEFRGVGTVDPESATRVRDGFGIASVAAGPNRSLHMVWQDARFSSGAFDSIVYSRSDDAGLTWSTPRRINARSDVPAFTPIINVRGDGVIGVAYYDFRANTASAQSLPTVTRLTTSTDGVVWYENEIEGGFDMLTAPIARGYFVGDYFGLTSRKGAFEAFLVRTTGNVTDNRTEGVFASVPEGTLKRSVSPTHAVVERNTSVIATDFRERINANIARMIAARRNGKMN
jgi:BNR/Asp-box repeat